MRKLFLSFVLLVAAVFVFASCAEESKNSNAATTTGPTIIPSLYSVHIQPALGTCDADTFILFDVKLYKSGEPVSQDEQFVFTSFKDEGVGRAVLIGPPTLDLSSDETITTNLSQNTIYNYKVESGKSGQHFGFTATYKGTTSTATYTIK